VSCSCNRAILAATTKLASLARCKLQLCGFQMGNSNCRVRSADSARLHSSVGLRSPRGFLRSNKHNHNRTLSLRSDRPAQDNLLALIFSTNTFSPQHTATTTIRQPCDCRTSSITSWVQFTIEVQSGSHQTPAQSSVQLATRSLSMISNRTSPMHYPFRSITISIKYAYTRGAQSCWRHQRKVICT
jgi:hypothetical protein